ncbi:MAG TPA: O-antigen ligase family protein [Steroidobacteraceae bacterium]|nr:O-antigen ligase family protein [Steroidobacteraceae bacterium]
MRASVAHRSVAASRVTRPAVRRAAGYAFLVPLFLLFWVIFYQNLPGALNGVEFKPIHTEGTIDRIIKICMIGISGAVLSARWSDARLLVKNVNPGLVAFMVLIPLSAAWSIDSAATLLRYTTLLSIVLLCLVIPLAGWDRLRLQQMTLPPVMTILVLSLAVGIVSPDLVKEIGSDISLKDAWHGITYQKNQLGTTASIATILCVHNWLAPGRHTFLTIAGAAIALTCLYLSKSSTSLMSMGLAVFFMTLMLWVPVIKRRFSTHLVVGLFTTILIYELAVQNLIPGVGTLLAPVMHLTGKDMTFSARSIIWDVIKEHSRAAPWLGTGYGAYWTGPTPSSPSYVFMYLMNFYPTESHNGYLEILNDLGRVGLVCLLAFLVCFVRQALQLLPIDRGQAVLYLALLFQQMVDNLSESEWFSRTATCTILLLASICLSRALSEQRASGTAASIGR